MKNSTGNNTNTHTQNTTTDLTVDFMTGNMVNLLKACRSLRELERLLTMLNGIDEDNRVLTLLRKMDSDICTRSSKESLRCTIWIMSILKK